MRERENRNLKEGNNERTEGNIDTIKQSSGAYRPIDVIGCRLTDVVARDFLLAADMVGKFTMLAATSEIV